MLLKNLARKGKPEGYPAPLKIRMPKSANRGNLSLPPFRQKVPADLAAHARGRVIHIALPAFKSDPAYTAKVTIGSHVKVSLRTRDPECWKLRTGIVAARL